MQPVRTINLATVTKILSHRNCLGIIYLAAVSLTLVAHKAAIGDTISAINPV